MIDGVSKGLLLALGATHIGNLSEESQTTSHMYS